MFAYRLWSSPLIHHLFFGFSSVLCRPLRSPMNRHRSTPACLIQRSTPGAIRMTHGPLRMITMSMSWKPAEQRINMNKLCWQISMPLVELTFPCMTTLSIHRTSPISRSTVRALTVLFSSHCKVMLICTYPPKRNMFPTRTMNSVPVRVESMRFWSNPTWNARSTLVFTGIHNTASVIIVYWLNWSTLEVHRMIPLTKHLTQREQSCSHEKRRLLVTNRKLLA